MLEIGGFGRAVEVAGGSAADPSFRRDLADATRRAVSGPRDGDAHYFARGAALIAALAVAGGWPDDAFPAGGAAAEPDEARARRWDDLWAAHESARGRLHPPASTPGLASQACRKDGGGAPGRGPSTTISSLGQAPIRPTPRCRTSHPTQRQNCRREAARPCRPG